jgi:hypothetical protein
MSAVVNDKETAARVAVLKRYRGLLSEQRDRFQSYVTVLEKQTAAIESAAGGSDAAVSAQSLIAHVDIEERLVADILAVQKTIAPMRIMYRAAYPDREEPEISALSRSIGSLKAEAQKNLEKNRLLLQTKMLTLRKELKTLQANPFLKWRSVYAQGRTPTLIDIQG